MLVLAAGRQCRLCFGAGVFHQRFFCHFGPAALHGNCVLATACNVSEIPGQAGAKYSNKHNSKSL